MSRAIVGAPSPVTHGRGLRSARQATMDFEQGLQDALGDSFRLQRELGGGGMSRVFLAEEVRLGRRVVVKILSSEFSGFSAERFEREIRLAAQLQHPAIVPLLQAGRSGDLSYFTMPYVEGESLRHRLRRGSLPVDDAIRILRDVAAALEYAHARGVVHRDIKPENILLTGRSALVADFGIAKALSAAIVGGESPATTVGTILGTPAYMAPEQAAGDSVDHRADLYAWGVMAYEMLAGAHPFASSRGAQALLAAHLAQKPASLAHSATSVPPAIAAIVDRCLDKDPALRPQSAADLVGVLEPKHGASGQRIRWLPSRPRWLTTRVALGVAGLLALLAIGVRTVRRGRSFATAATEAKLRRVGVLYFATAPGASDMGYLADGLTESLIDELARAPGLTVISRNGSALVRNAEASDSVARVLRAGTLVDGTVARRGSDAVVTVRIIDGESGETYRRATFAKPLNDPLKVRDAVAIETARLLRVWLGEEIRVTEAAAATHNAAAWAALQRGERRRKDAEALLRAHAVDSARLAFGDADSLFAYAAILDTAWADPTIARAVVTYRTARLVERDPPSALKLARQALGYAGEALRRDRTNARALEQLGTIRYYIWLLRVTPDPKEQAALKDSAQSDLEAAVQRNPRLASAFATLSHLYMNGTNGDASAAIAAQRALEADEFLDAADVILYRLFNVTFNLANFTAARRWCAEGARRFPANYRFAHCRLRLLASPAVEPNTDSAWALLALLDSLAPAQLRPFEHLRGQMTVAGVIARAAKSGPPGARARDSARAVLLDAQHHASPAVDPGGELVAVEAYIRVLLGDYDQAIALLEASRAAAPEQWDSTNVSWYWRDLAGHPRFKRLFGGSK